MIRTLDNVRQVQFAIDSGGASQLRNECDGGMRMRGNCRSTTANAVFLGNKAIVSRFTIRTHLSLSSAVGSLFFLDQVCCFSRSRGSSIGPRSGTHGRVRKHLLSDFQCKILRKQLIFCYHIPRYRRSYALVDGSFSSMTVPEER